MAKYTKPEEIITSLEEQLESVGLVIGTHLGGVDKLAELEKKMIEDRRTLKYLRKVLARENKSTRSVDYALREQLVELEQVSLRKQGIRAHAHRVISDEWEMKSTVAALKELVTEKDPE